MILLDMTKRATDVAISVGGTVSAFGVAEWNQIAGIVAFTAAAAFSITKTYFMVRDRLRCRDCKANPNKSAE